MLNLARVTGGEERMRVKEHAKNAGIILYLRCGRGLAQRQGGPRVTWCQALSSHKVPQLREHQTQASTLSDHKEK